MDNISIEIYSHIYVSGTYKKWEQRCRSETDLFRFQQALT